jgi:flagellar basal body-associated protein FliL|tara:strand:- start:624 stop:794 length:171 start_codon:yes stop_codon:yes gene_type:complete
MDLIVIIILCVVIALALILFPLVVSRKAENAAVKKSEWNKIQDYGNKINRKTRDNK